MVRIFYLFFFGLFFQSLYAQDYYVTFKQDTVYGLIKSAGNYNIKFKKDSSSSWQKLDSKTARVYYLAKKGEKRLSILMPLIDVRFPDPKFKELIEEGKINVVIEEYSRPGFVMGSTGLTPSAMGGSTSGRFLYVQKGENTRAWNFERKFVGVRENGTEKSRKKFEELISDKPELLKRFQAEQRIEFDELIKYVREYNTL
jgi:hypothetical protein